MTRQENRKQMSQFISREEYQEKINLDDRKITVVPDYVKHEDMIMGRV